MKALFSAIFALSVSLYGCGTTANTDQSPGPNEETQDVDGGRAFNTSSEMQVVSVIMQTEPAEPAPTEPEPTGSDPRCTDEFSTPLAYYTFPEESEGIHVQAGTVTHHAATFNFKACVRVTLRNLEYVAAQTSEGYQSPQNRLDATGNILENGKLAISNIAFHLPERTLNGAPYGEIRDDRATYRGSLEDESITLEAGDSFQVSLSLEVAPNPSRNKEPQRFNLYLTTGIVTEDCDLAGCYSVVHWLPLTLEYP